MDDIEKQEISNNMDMLKRKFVNVSKNDIENLNIELQREYRNFLHGVPYLELPIRKNNQLKMYPNKQTKNLKGESSQ